MRQEHWVVKEQDAETVRRLSTGLNVSELIAKLLINRGMDTVEKARIFLNKSIDGLHDPLLLPDMEKAVERINRAVEQREKILIYGDYDVDGVTAVSVVYLYLHSLGAQVEYYIPDRAGEGYGVSMAAIERMEQEGVTLMITVDTGVTAVEEAKRAAQGGIDLIVTDHHECGGELPEAYALINPKLPGSAYPFQDLAGVGVAFKLVCALAGRTQLQTMIDRFSELVCLGTVADVMPLWDENRIIVSCGLKRLERTGNLGLRALVEKAGLGGKKMTASALSYTLCPRINAVGRIGCAMRAVELFLADSQAKAAAIAGELCEINRRRQEEEASILEDAVARIEGEPAYLEDRLLVLGSDSWHHGVIGIVASRLTERYGKPTVLVSFDGETGKGSGRSVKGFNLYEALGACADHLLKFGGHELAAGLTISREELEPLRRAINDYARRQYPEKLPEAPLEADCELSAADITIQKSQEILFLEPYGMGNPVPVFYLKEALLDDVIPVGNERHLKLNLHKNGTRISAIFFGHSPASFELCAGDRVDLVCNMDLNTYRGEQNVQLVVRDMALSVPDYLREKSSWELYERYRAGAALSDGELAELLPGRENFVAVYRFFLTWKGGAAQPELLCRRIEHSAQALTLCRVRLCMDVFQEMGLLICRMEDGLLRVECPSQKQKVNLNASRILSGLRERAGKQ